MALRVWLPLDGDTRNIGCSGITMSGAPASWGTNGKIGKCATFAGSTSNVIYNNTSDYNYTDNFSWSVWVNNNYNSSIGTTQYAFTVGRVDATGYGYGLQSSGANKMNLRFGNGSWVINFNGGEWHHLAMTVSGTTVFGYLDGELSFTQTVETKPTYENGNGIGLGCFHYSSNIYPFYGSLNDFRIYDHCLSPKEVKEISQGLVLHYKLDGWSGGTNTNLVNGTSEQFQSASISQYYYQLHSNNSFWGLSAGDTATYRVYLRAPAGKKVRTRIQFYTSDSQRVSLSGNYINAGEEGYSTLTWTMTDAQRAYSTMQLLIDCNDGTTNTDTFFWKELKLEKGSIATAYSQSPSDLCIDTTKVKDSSGYENNGSVTGTLDVDQSTPRYGVSTKWVSATSLIDAPYNPIGSNAFTVSAWFYRTGGGATYYAAKNNYNTWVCLENGRYFVYSSSGTAYVGTWTSTKDTWQHIVLVHDAINTKLKLYVNGSFVSEVTTDGTIYSSDILNIGGRQGTGGYIGSISDFRIYATALSADDIKELYNISANIDNQYNMHGFELVEDYSKQGISKVGQILNNGSTKTYLVNNFAETNTMTDWTFTAGTISNGVVTTTGTNPSITSKTFTVNPDDIIVVDVTLSMPTPSTSTSGQGLYLGTLSSANTNRYNYNFNTHTWGAAQSNASTPWNTYFLSGYNSTNTVRIKSYILGSSVNIVNIPDAYCSLSSIGSTNAIQLTSGTTTNIRAGYNSGNTTMVIKLYDFKIYNLNTDGFCEVSNVAKVGAGYYQANKFIEK